MVDHALALPWDRYENHDMVVWGVRERVEEGEMEGVSLHLPVLGPLSEPLDITSTAVIATRVADRTHALSVHGKDEVVQALCLSPVEEDALSP
jgi:hypothetical protein